MELIDHPNGSYRFVPGIAPYSAGVVSMPEHEIVWVTLRRPAPYEEGLEKAVRTVSSEGAPSTSICAIALRAPEPMSLEEFEAFNHGYRAVLAGLDIVKGDPNPVARTNVIPIHAPPAGPVLYGFGYSRRAPAGSSGITFVVAGAAELRDQALDDRTIVRPGDTSGEGLVEKARVVMAAMEQRLDALGASWEQVTAMNVYTRHDISALSALLLQPLRTGAIHGMRWYPSTPPITGLEFEMDVRGVRDEVVVE